MKPRIYFDTNIYRHISQCEEKDAVRRLLRQRDLHLIASATNLHETYAIPDSSLREREIATLTAVASKFESHPESWFQALELRKAIRKHRAQWLRPVTYRKQIRRHLENHQKKWQIAKRGFTPTGPSSTQYRHDSEAGIRSHVTTQKALRQERLSERLERVLVNSRWGRQYSNPLDLDDPEIFWRADCLLVWAEALVMRNPSSRDYADWLDPYLKPGVFEASDYAFFWLEDVEPSEVPKNRITSLISFYQLERKITHGNPADSLHACHALDVDVFLTGDRAFFEALQKAHVHFDKLAKPVFIDRSSSKITNLLAEVL